MTTKHRSLADDVRIGPLSMFALIAILSMAVLAVLSISSANASFVISQRQANAVSDAYLAEMSAQDFVGWVDFELAVARKTDDLSGAGDAVADALPSIARHVEEGSEGRIAVDAAVEDGRVKASFSCDGARTLNILVTILPDGTLRVDEWAMAAVQNEAAPGGALWTGE